MIGITNNLRAWTTVALAVTLAAALIALAALARPDQAATRTVTKTFANPSPILIPAGSPATSMGPASPYPSKFEVSGLRRGRILDVNLALKNYSHTYPLGPGLAAGKSHGPELHRDERRGWPWTRR